MKIPFLKTKAQGKGRMQIEEVREILSKVKIGFPESWLLSAYEYDKRVYVSLSMKSIESDKWFLEQEQQEETTWLTDRFDFANNDLVTEKALVDLVYQQYLVVLTHEAGEFFVYDGNRPFHPHRGDM